MNFKELLSSLSDDVVIEEICNNFYDIQTLGLALEPPARNRVKCNFAGLINSLKERTSIDNKGNFGILVFKDGPEYICESYSYKDIPFDFKGESYEELERYIKRHSLEFCPWSETLGYTVNERCFEYVLPETFCAAVLYSMTFFGFSESELEAKTKEIEKSLNEADEEYKNNPSSAKPFEEVMANLYKSVGEEYVPPTKSEEEKYRKALEQSVRANLKVYLKLLQ